MMDSTTIICYVHFLPFGDSDQADRQDYEISHQANLGMQFSILNLNIIIFGKFQHFSKILRCICIRDPGPEIYLDICIFKSIDTKTEKYQQTFFPFCNHPDFVEMRMKFIKFSQCVRTFTSTGAISIPNYVRQIRSFLNF